MLIHRTAAVLLVGLALPSGCAVFAPQPLGENFALMEGTRANHPGLIDGDLRTMGESEPPASEAANSSIVGTPPTEAVVLLPTERVITKIVVHSEEILSLDLLFESSSSGWVIHDKYDGLKGPSFVLKPRGLVSASGVKLRIRRGTGDKALQKKNVQRAGGYTIYRGPTRANVKIREIELFGPVSVRAAKTVEAPVEAPADENASTSPEDLLLDGLLD